MTHIPPDKLLIGHLKAVLEEAENDEFHDFKNKKYPLPKIELVMQLENIIKNVKNGLYDNPAQGGCERCGKGVGSLCLDCVKTLGY